MSCMVNPSLHGRVSSATWPKLCPRQFETLRPFRAAPFAHDTPGTYRLALSESAWGPAPAALEAAHQAVAEAQFYPHSDGEPLRQALAKHYGVEAEGVHIGNGADEVLLIATLAVAGSGEVGVVTSGTFAGHRAALEVAGCDVRELPMERRRLPVAELAAATGDARVMILANPHNPTGSALGSDEIARIVSCAAQNGCVVVLDEAYGEFADPASFGSGLDLLSSFNNVIVVRTFSKAYGLAGLRCGYAIGSPALVDGLAAVRTVLPYNVNRVALAAATAALRDQEYLRGVVRDNRASRAAIVRRFREAGLHVVDSEANFVLLDVGAHADAVLAGMDQRGVLARPLAALGYPGAIRLGVCRTDDVAAVVEAVVASEAAAVRAE